MYSRLRTNKREIIKLLVALGLIYVVLRAILMPLVNSPEFRDFVDSLGVWGYLVIIAYVVFSHVFAPVAGSPGVVLGITLYGVYSGLWLLYVGSMISSVINFYITRKYGRGLVVKLIGLDSMKKIDEFVKLEGREAIVVGRLFGFALFDFISYASGLTKIKFREYFFITVVVEFIVILALQSIYKSVDFNSEMGVLIWISSMFMAGGVFGLLIMFYIKRKKH